MASATDFSPHLSHELFDKRCFQGVVDGYSHYTIVADGDWTLYKAKSHEDTFGTSPARDDVLAWIRAGIKTDFMGSKTFTHHLILTTGGDYQMARDRFIAYLPADIRPAVTLVTNSGARLFYYDGAQYQESTHYTAHALEGGVCIDRETEELFVTTSVSLLNLFFSYLQKDPILQEEVLKAPYGEWVQKFAKSYPEAGYSLDDFRKENRILYGIYKSLELCPRIEIRGISEKQVVQISIVGMFSNLPALQKYPDFQQILAQLGKYPNTILSQNLCVLEVSRTDKGSALSYLGLHPDFSCGIGDSPAGNDKPLTEYAQTINGKQHMMPFISVAENPPKELLNGYHIGHKVEGSQAFLKTLLQTQSEPSSRSFRETVEEAQRRASF